MSAMAYRPRKRKKGLRVFVSIIVILSLLLGIIFLVANNYLSKINFEEETLAVNPDLVETIPLDPNMKDQFKQADDDISKNISDNILWYNDNVLNILLVGCDYGDTKQYYPRSDSMIIASVNKVQKTITFASLSRAAYVSIPGHGNARLNAAYAYGGPKLLKQTIEKNYKVRIDHYVSIDFDGFQKVINILGGVKITLSESEYEAMKEQLINPQGPGQYTLLGSEALNYCRLRSIDTDRDRTQRQRNVLKQITVSARSMSLSQGLQILNEILPLVTTDYSKSELVGQAATMLGYVTYSVREAVIPKNQPGLVLVDGYEVIMLKWGNVRRDIHEILYKGVEPVTQAQ